MEENTNAFSIKRFLYFLFCILTAMVGYTIHGNFFYSLINFLLAPFSWIFWLIGHDVNMTVIKTTFGFLLQ